MGVHNLDAYPEIKKLLDIPADEPIFILRAQDGLAVGSIENYKRRYADIGRTFPFDDNFHDSLNDVIGAFRDWQSAHPGSVKFPD